MSKLLQWIFLGHVHHWDTPEIRSKVYDPDNPGGRPVGFSFVCRCQKCGAWKRFKV